MLPLDSKEESAWAQIQSQRQELGFTEKEKWRRNTPCSPFDLLVHRLTPLVGSLCEKDEDSCPRFWRGPPCYAVLRQLSTTALAHGHLEVWVPLLLRTWKATKKSNSLLWIHLTAVLISDGKFSRVCSQEDAVSQPRPARESIAAAGQNVRAREPAERSCSSGAGLASFLPHCPRLPCGVGWAGLLLLHARGEHRKLVCSAQSASLPPAPHIESPLLTYRGCARTQPPNTHPSRCQVATAPTTLLPCAAVPVVHWPTKTSETEWRASPPPPPPFFLHWSYLCHRLYSRPGGRTLWLWLMFLSHGHVDWPSPSQPGCLQVRHLPGSPILAPGGQRLLTDRRAWWSFTSHTGVIRAETLQHETLQNIPTTTTQTHTQKSANCRWYA